MSSFYEKLDLLTDIRKKDKALQMACGHLARGLCNASKGLNCIRQGNEDCTRCWYEFLEKESEKAD